MITITDIETFSVTLPAAVRLQIASGLSFGPGLGIGHVIVKVDTSEKVIGIGESSPIYVHLGTKEETVVAIKKYITPAIVGMEVFNIAQIINKIEHVVPHNLYAKAAIDIALWDVIGKILNVPVYELLGGCSKRNIPLCWTIGINTVEEAIREAEEKKKEGFKGMKIKIGAEPSTDIERTAAIREIIGDNNELWVDCNQGYTVKEAIRVAMAIEPYNPIAMEQPIPRYDITGLARISRAVNIPIMADESSHTPEQVIQLIKLEAADMFSHKLTRSGGIFRSKQMLAIAEAANTPVILASNDETGISTAAGAHLYVSTPIIQHSAELTGPLMAKDDVIKPGLKIENGFIYVPDRPGLGIELDETKIKEYMD